MSTLDKRTIEVVLDYLVHMHIEVANNEEDFQKMQKIKLGMSKAIDYIRELNSSIE